MKDSKRKPLIALDADGVLLDYAAAYAGAWERAFGERPTLKNPHAYWPIDRWGVRRLAGEELDRLRSAFDDRFWSSIPPVEGALRACHMLVDAGYTLVCVTALQDRHRSSRERNLRELGFPIEQVITTPGSEQTHSPKAPALAELEPVAFVDDYAPYLRGIGDLTHKALILRHPDGSPNTGDELAHADSTHRNLAEFAAWWLERERMASLRTRQDGASPR